MPPTLKRSSTRYLPARVSPSKGSPLVSSAVPSRGQSVLVSEYSVPQCGHFFIGRWCLFFLLLSGGWRERNTPFGRQAKLVRKLISCSGRKLPVCFKWKCERGHHCHARINF